VRMRFEKDAHRINRRCGMRGQSIIITDDHDWGTAEIVQAPLLIGEQPIHTRSDALTAFAHRITPHGVVQRTPSVTRSPLTQEREKVTDRP